MKLAGVMKPRLALVVVVTALGTTLGCTAPMSAVPIRAGDRCYRCERVIADQSLAAEGIAAPGVVRKFRTVACMLKYLNQSGETVDSLVTDSSSGRFVSARRASFVRATVYSQTGDQDYQDYLAFGDRVVANTFAADRRTKPLDWETVQALERVHSSVPW